MALTLSGWHQRYLQQARWTESLRTYLYQKTGLRQASRVLDVGCGTGVLERELSASIAKPPFGLDINNTALEFAHEYAPGSSYTVGDGTRLPFGEATFDACLCHFYLLWVRQVKQAVGEMARVTRPGGYVLALAEPDYGGRVDYPEELAQAGKWQGEALLEQGADPLMGRKLRSLFSKAGLGDTEVGVLGAQWVNNASDQDVELEWQVLASDLANNPEFTEQVKILDIEARRTQQRILFVPVFYAIGKVSKSSA